jgi:hypothetical protein
VYGAYVRAITSNGPFPVGNDVAPALVVPAGADDDDEEDDVFRSHPPAPITSTNRGAMSNLMYR